MTKEKVTTVPPAVSKLRRLGVSLYPKLKGLRLTILSFPPVVVKLSTSAFRVLSGEFKELLVLFCPSFSVACYVDSRDNFSTCYRQNVYTLPHSQITILTPRMLG